MAAHFKTVRQVVIMSVPVSKWLAARPDYVLAAIALSATLGVVVYGASVAIESTRDLAPTPYVLEYADGKKAIFRDPDVSIRVVRVGSVLPGAGNVTEIKQAAGRWVVATSKGFSFIKD
jgi:hypothetical protein